MKKKHTANVQTFRKPGRPVFKPQAKYKTISIVLYIQCLWISSPMCVALLSGPPSFLYLYSNPLQLPAEKLLKGRKSLRPRALPELQTAEGLNSDPSCIRSCEWTYKSETLFSAPPTCQSEGGRRCSEQI